LTLFNKITSPVLQDINITWQDGSVVDYWPKSVGDLYQSEPIQVVMEIPKGQQGQSLKLTGYQLEKGEKTVWIKILKVDENKTASGIS
jgi:Ca-activated chloride channel family protein